MDWLNLFFTTFGLIFALIDPLGYVPLFLSMTSTATSERRQKMLRRACTTAFCVLLAFILFGNALLTFFHISIPALQISGGLILLFIGLEMLGLMRSHERLSPTEESEAAQKDDISIVPLAIPMLSGPASIVAVVVLTGKDSSIGSLLAVTLSVLATLLLTYFVLGAAERVMKVVGITGVNAASRIMGLLLCAMAVQFMIDGYLAIGTGISH
jgi:multiple antibiotic resistance protein